MEVQKLVVTLDEIKTKFISDVNSGMCFHLPYRPKEECCVLIESSN